MTEKEVKAMDYIVSELSDVIGFWLITKEEEWEEWMKVRSASFEKQMASEIEELFLEE